MRHQRSVIAFWHIQPLLLVYILNLLAYRCFQTINKAIIESFHCDKMIFFYICIRKYESKKTNISICYAGCQYCDVAVGCNTPPSS